MRDECPEEEECLGCRGGNHCGFLFTGMLAGGGDVNCGKVEGVCDGALSFWTVRGIRVINEGVDTVRTRPE